MSRFIYYYAECRNAECRYPESRHAECLYAECCYAECRGALARPRTEQLGELMVHIYFIIYSIANFYADFLQREPEESPLAFTDCFFLQKLLPKLYL